MNHEGQAIAIGSDGDASCIDARIVVHKILISACLLGERVRYHGGDARIEHPLLRRWHEEGRLVPVCPEVAGGLTTLRPAAELVTTATSDRRVLTAAGKGVTAACGRGAAAALDACRTHAVRIAILKDGSPSCGSRTVWDGTFSARRVDGQGMTAASLAAAGVRIFNETELEAAAEYLGTLESGQV